MGKILDISKWQPTVNYKELATECDLAILRVQDGSRVIDHIYDRHASGCEKNNIPYGVYAFCRYTSVEDAKVEARDFYKRSIVNGHKPLFYVADVEEKTMKDMRAGTNAFIAELRKLGVEKVGIYIAHHYHNSFNLDYSKADFKWIPRYALDGKTIIPPQFSCDLHQWTEKGRIAGINAPVDLNRLTGTKSLKWFTAGHEEEEKETNNKPKPKPKPKPSATKRYKVTATLLNIRKSPSNDGAILGQLEKGQTVQVVSIDKDGWAKLKSNDKHVYVYSAYLKKV